MSAPPAATSIAPDFDRCVMPHAASSAPPSADATRSVSERLAIVDLGCIGAPWQDNSKQRTCLRRNLQSSSHVDRPRIGCSGWNYKGWRGKFYPLGLPSSRWLDYYASIFDTVEINNTFYRLPEKSTFACWKRQMPRGFAVAVKASRFLTHIKRLKDPQEPIDRLFSRAKALG